MDPVQLPLRDIHLPEPISWWPLAPGWWILLLTIILVAVSVIVLLRHRNKLKYSPGNQAKLELQTIHTEYNKHGDTKYLVCELSSLIRRLSISIFPREQIAGLTGDVWLEFLDQAMRNHIGQVKPFTTGVGCVLSEGPYRQQTDIDSEQLLSLCEEWIVQVVQYSKVVKEVNGNGVSGQ